jgi:acyl phosphate:glycerol-3-phosphate acyltransferase
VTVYIAIATIAYLLGSVPFGYILVRLFRGQDVRKTGSGNVGAMNVARLAPPLGALTAVLDATKGLLAVTVGSVVAANLGPSTARPRLYSFAAVAALFAVVGHIFPVWLKFRGGKGMATSIGIFLVLAPKTLVIALALFLVLAAAFRYLSLASMIVAVMFPIIAYELHDYHSSPEVLTMSWLITGMVIFKHRKNFRRLLAGTEPRIALKGNKT